jgi:opacity protein-like surface antigen
LYLSVSCDSLKNEVEDVDYTQAAIAVYVDKLNRCISPSETNAIVYKKDKSYLHLYAYGGGISFSNKYELAGRITARVTIPAINKSMSVNVGLNVMTDKKIYTVASHFNGYIKTLQTEYRTIFSVPFTVQYDFLPGNIKPYVEAGLSLVYLDAHITQDYLSYKVNDRKFGLGVIGAVGVEGSITKRLMIKADWRYELFLHYPTIGMGYVFK